MEWIELTDDTKTEAEVLAVNDKGDFLLGYLGATDNWTGFFCQNEHEYLDNVTHYLIPTPPQNP